jgi:serine protease
VNANAAVDAALGTVPPVDPPGTIAEAEPNNSRAAAQVVSTDNTTVNGVIGSTSDNDYYRVSLPAGRTLVSTLQPNAASDYDLYVYNSSGSLLGGSENGTGAADVVSVTNTGSGALVRYIRVVRWSGGTGATNGRYTLNLNW